MTCGWNVWNSGETTDRRHYGRFGHSFFVPAARCQALPLACQALHAQDVIFNAWLKEVVLTLLPGATRHMAAWLRRR
jgi:hypothetical protein